MQASFEAELHPKKNQWGVAIVAIDLPTNT
jgi:hypothetical protein